MKLTLKGEFLKIGTTVLLIFACTEVLNGTISILIFVRKKISGQCIFCIGKYFCICKNTKIENLIDYKFLYL